MPDQKDDIYTRIFDFCWTPVRFIAGIFLSHEWFPQYAPWILAARLGRWPERVRDIDPEDIKDLSPEVRELVLKRSRE